MIRSNFKFEARKKNAHFFERSLGKLVFFLFFFVGEIS